MSKDIRLYIEDITQQRDVILKSANLSDVPAFDLEVLGNKVVKFLKTTRGSDPMEPQYGGRAFSTPQISREYLPKFRMELENDLARCMAYIKNSEARHKGNREKLSRIILRELDYDPALRLTTIHIYLEILTTKRNKAKVSIQKSLG